MTQLVIDPIPDPVTASFVPLFGWLRAPASPASVTCSAFGIPLYHELHARTDLANLFPSDFTTGLYAVVDLAEWAPRLAAERRRLPLEVRIDGSLLYTHSLEVSQAAIDTALAGVAHRRAKRAFLQAHAACVACGDQLVVAEPRPAEIVCFKCGCRFAQRTRALSVVPGDPRIPRLISTSVFPYSPDERQVIDEATASGGMALDFGAGLRATIEPRVINLEIADYPTTDVVAMSDRLPFVDAAFDAVISLHVLEHLQRPWLAAREIQRVLKPGGRVICTVPYICAEHGFPDHFFNMTRSGLKSLFEGMTLERHFIKGDGAPLNGIQQLLSTYYGNLPEPHRSAFGRVTVNELVHTPLPELLGKAYAVNLPGYAQWLLPAHTTVVFRKA